MTDAATSNKKSKPKPRSVVELEAELAEAERSLSEAQRANSAAKTRLPALIAQADSEAIDECRHAIGDTAKAVRVLTEELEFYREAVKLAQVREHGAFNVRRLMTLQKLEAAMVRDHEALEEIITQLGAALKTARESAQELEIELNQCNVNYDAFLSVSTRLIGRSEMWAYLETDGAFGRARTLDSPVQLRESGRASLSLAAKEFRTLTLRTARMTLGFPADEGTSNG
jgi:hypothetical protein